MVYQYGVKCFNYVIEKELFYEAVDFEFFKQAKFFFLKKLENMGCMSLFNIDDEVCPQLVHPFYANFKKLEPQGRYRT